MALKIYLLASEITPFAQQYQLADFVNHVSRELKEREHDIRLIMPKYGFISSRKYVLREVIRLRDIEAHWRNEVFTGNVRSAFVPDTKVQVYFLELPEYFDEVNHLLYKAQNGRPLKNNVDRFGLFSKIALRTLEKLFWQPDVIIANDWASAFAVVLHKKLFSYEEFFTPSKSILMLHSLDELLRFSPEVLQRGEIEPDDIELVISGKTRLLDIASALADEVIIVNSEEENVEKEIEQDKDLSEILANRTRQPHVISGDGDADTAWEQVAV
ncbi:MAG TPA: glycogen/starch synthase, partial [bacterium]|nr:glycogen/starch synthase [bacterium]